MILKRKAFRSLIAILIVIACITSNLFVATADKVAEKANIDVAVDTSKGKNSYSVYLSKNSKSEYSSEDVICKLNGKIIEKESVDFKINVEKDGLYALGMSYKALDDDMSEIRIGLKIDGKDGNLFDETELDIDITLARNIQSIKDAGVYTVVVTAAVKKIDQAANKGIIHKNNAARKKSALVSKMNKANA